MSRKHDKGLDDTTEIEINGPHIIEIDANAIAIIIESECKAPPLLAIRAANRILGYLMSQHNNPARPQ